MRDQTEGPRDVTGADDIVADDYCPELDEESGEEESMLSVQLTISSCWLSLKEASLVVGALARHLPFHSKTFLFLVLGRSTFPVAVPQLKRQFSTEKISH